VTSMVRSSIGRRFEAGGLHDRTAAVRSAATRSRSPGVVVARLRTGFAPVVGLLAVVVAHASPAATVVTVMSFNVWGAGTNAGKPIGETVAAIRASGADIIGLQETRPQAGACQADDCPPDGRSVAGSLAAALGFYYYEQTGENAALWANAILSRYPIGRSTPHDLGVAIDVGGRRVYAFNVHLPDAPYQPYQLLGIDYGDAPLLRTEAEAVDAAQRARGPALALLLEDLAEAANADAVFVFGDFNEPSHRDWTARAVAAGRHPLVVRFPATSLLEERGYVDALRAVFPDEVAKPAFTWTPTTRPDDAGDHHDRIDFVFARGAGLLVERAGIVGEKAPEADIVVTPWPSDHRAVFATVRF